MKCEHSNQLFFCCVTVSSDNVFVKVVAAIFFIGSSIFLKEQNSIRIKAKSRFYQQKRCFRRNFYQLLHLKRKNIK